jgi:hypothetical protein
MKARRIFEVTGMASEAFVYDSLEEAFGRRNLVTCGMNLHTRTIMAEASRRRC